MGRPKPAPTDASPHVQITYTIVSGNERSEVSLKRVNWHRDDVRVSMSSEVTSFALVRDSL